MKLYGENKAVACVPVVKQRSDWVASAARHGSVRAGGFEIGRASCRERV